MVIYIFRYFEKKPKSLSFIDHNYYTIGFIELDFFRFCKLKFAKIANFLFQYGLKEFPFPAAIISTSYNYIPPSILMKL